MSSESAAEKSIEFPEKQPHPYQEDMLGSILDARDSGVERTYIDSATGSGKDFVIARAVKHFIDVDPSERILYLAHNRFVLNEAAREISEINPAITQGRMFGGEFQDQGQITFATFHTQNRQLGTGRVYETCDPKEYDTVIVNESHHAPAPTYRPVIEHYNPKFLLGATATAERRDQQDIKEIFGEPIYTLKLEEAIARGYLARPDYHVLTDKLRDLDKMTDMPKGIDKKDIEAINGMVFVPKRDEEIVKTIEEHLDEVDDPRTIIFCGSINHTEYYSELLSGESAALHSELPDKEQDDRLEAFRTGKIPTLLVVDMLNEAVDVPEINTVVFLRSTESGTVFFQQLGRGLRKVRGKEQVKVLDFVANWDRLSTLQNLQSRISKHKRSSSGEPRESREVDADISFNFSPEAMEAVGIINEARERSKPKRAKPKETPRLDKWSEHEKAVMEMMELTSLPRQDITKKEWEQYGKRIAESPQNARKKAMQELVMRRLRFAYGQAKYHFEKTDSSELTLEDCFQCVIEGMYEGFDRYDPNKHVSLQETIGQALRNPLQKMARKRGLIKLANSVHDKQYTIQKTEEKLAKELGGNTSNVNISDQDIAEAGGLDLEEIADIRQINEFVDYESHASFEDIGDVEDRDDEGAEQKVLERLRAKDLLYALEYLSYRERRVITMINGLFGEHRHRINEAARIFNVSSERVRQINHHGLKKLELLPDAQALREPEDIPRYKTPRQEKINRVERERKNVKKSIFKTAKNRLRESQHEEFIYSIYEDEGPGVGALAQLIAKHLPDLLLFDRDNRALPLDKHRLAEHIQDQFLQADHRISHTDYIRALNALEQHGAVELHRNDRGTVINSVSMAR